METAANSVAQQLRSDPQLAIPATLIAIDCEADESDPILTLADANLVHEWKTIRNTHLNTPRQLLRSIITQSLATLGDEKPEMAAVIWNTAFSPLKHNQARLGKERVLVTRLLQDLQGRAEAEALGRFRLPEQPVAKLPAGKSIPFSKLKDEDILGDVGRSAGPHDAAGTGFEDPNPNWPNSGPQWSYDFTPRMTAALVKAVNTGTRRALAATNKELQAQRTELNRLLTTHLEAFRSQGLRQAQLDVLWWSEAKYSASLRMGYREMRAAAAAVMMAHDLSLLVPAMAPASVAYVLGEAVAAVSEHDSRAEPWTVGTLLEDLRTNNLDLQTITADGGVSDGRASLFSIVAQIVKGDQIRNEYVSTKTGIDPSLEIPLPDFSMWLFRDIQARRLVEGLM